MKPQTQCQTHKQTERPAEITIHAMIVPFFSSSASRLLLLAILLLLSFSQARGDAPTSQNAENPSSFTARKSLVYQYAGQPPMRMPTDVAIAADGALFVADGVNNRILQFDPKGNMIRAINAVGDQTLSRPIGLSVDSAKRLWIADTGNSRVLAMSPDGSLAQKIALPQSPDARAPSITDVAAAPDGKAIWVVDNHNHRLVRIEPTTGIQSVVGRMGESLGQLNHPFMIALGRDEAVFVTDVLNGRISSFTAAGQPAVSVGKYGGDLGEIYRPKGIACDTSGNIWVADSVIGVIQVFSAQRRLIDVVRDEAGQPLRLNTPTGIAVDGKGNLFVVELTADRVSKFEIDRGADSQAPHTQPQASQQLTGQQARSCTVCHLEWMEPFSRGNGTALMKSPASLPDEPYVSSSGSCLSCHDGSMVDSRRRVWQEHGHRTGMKPPANISVPAALPLVDGKIACRTCHSAHVSGQFNADVSTAVFLRVKNESSELCVSCHADKTRGPSFGTHPTGGMPWPVPKKLVDAGARLGANPRELTCQVCHTPHGSANDHLLVLGTGSNELCMTCHDQMRPGMFRDDSRTEHPLRPAVNAEQAAAVRELGTKLGDDDRLICLSCHKLHHGKGEHFMLAEELTDSRFCIRCHSQKTSLVGSSHDLRTNFPEEKNRLGMTPQAGGPCSACHLFHRYARAPEASDLDPAGGKCITCHQSGRCAGSKTLGAVNHPKAACVECHDPHSMAQQHFLRAPPGELCITCHAEQSKLAGGPHDATAALSQALKPDAAAQWPLASLEQKDTCLACHRPHGDKETGLFRIPPAVAAAPSDGACIACHHDSAWQNDSKWAAVHPQTITASIKQPSLPLVNTTDGSTAIGCRTCHNPHADQHASSQLLRVKQGQPSQSLCLTCHTENSAISLTGHDTTVLDHAGLSADACKPCHSVHAERRSLRSNLLTTTQTDLCITCHREGGAARVPEIVSHPDVAMAQVASTEVMTLPVFNSSGEIDPNGKIQCLTCHLPHGRLPDSQLATPGEREKLDAMPMAQRSAMRLMLRSFESSNICVKCHGQDALRRFLYFHDPAKRHGSLLPSGGATTIRRPRL